jgi:capsular polysaccharide biosynthesis protein
MNSSQRQSWIREHLKVFPVENTFLVGFTASTDKGQRAAAIANAVAAAYCEVRRARSLETRHGRDQTEVEILEPATVPTRPDQKSNPLMAGLMNGLGDAGLFMLGAAIGYLGFLAETIRGKLAQARRTAEGAVDP